MVVVVLLFMLEWLAFLIAYFKGTAMSQQQSTMCKAYEISVTRTGVCLHKTSAKEFTCSNCMRPAKTQACQTISLTDQCK